MTEEANERFDVVLVGGPLNAHLDDEHVIRTIERPGLPQRITATPGGLFFDLDVPATVGRYERDDEREVDDVVAPDAVYVWTPPVAP